MAVDLNPGHDELKKGDLAAFPWVGVDPVTADPSLDAEAASALQFEEDVKYRNRLFSGAAGRVNAASNLVKSLEANRQMNEAKAYSDAAKLLSGLQTPQGPTESMAALGVTEDLAGQAARTRAEMLQQSAQSIYGAEDALSQAVMEEAEVRKGASISAEREAKLMNFIQTVSALRADYDAGVISRDQLNNSIQALIQMTPDPLLASQMAAAAATGPSGTYTVGGEVVPGAKSGAEQSWFGKVVDNIFPGIF